MPKMLCEAGRRVRCGGTLNIPCFNIAVMALTNPIGSPFMLCENHGKPIVEQMSLKKGNLVSVIEIASGKFDNLQPDLSPVKEIKT